MVPMPGETALTRSGRNPRLPFPNLSLSAPRRIQHSVCSGFPKNRGEQRRDCTYSKTRAHFSRNTFPTTSATPGITAMPKNSSRLSNGGASMAVR